MRIHSEGKTQYVATFSAKNAMKKPEQDLLNRIRNNKLKKKSIPAKNIKKLEKKSAEVKSEDKKAVEELVESAKKTATRADAIGPVAFKSKVKIGQKRLLNNTLINAVQSNRRKDSKIKKREPVKKLPPRIQTQSLSIVQRHLNKDSKALK